MPHPNTFTIPPIYDFVRSYLVSSLRSIDPFAGNNRLAEVTNDLNPDSPAMHHMDAEAFLSMMAQESNDFDLLLFDPPYSPRQISECYRGIGLEVGVNTQNASLYTRCRNAAMPLLTDSAIVLSFGWNTVGMGKKRNFEIIEIMLVCHGGAHNDTICLAEQRISSQPGLSLL